MNGLQKFWQGKQVLVTGHTGFKGSWLSLWLSQLGANVTGIALEPESNPALFEQLDLESKVNHHIGDIRNAEAINKLIAELQPEVVFHLAAQPLVIRSYEEPIDTWGTNVIGTANILSGLNQLTRKCAAVIITTDKVYENLEWEFGYRETDRLGGHDPYSASKAACEILCESWRRSFFEPRGYVRLATARAGNVIGGGDWSVNRIVPDIVRAVASGEPVKVRNPQSTRPWQHVLDPLHGYLTLAEKLFESEDKGFQAPFNFGPTSESQRSVGDLVKQVLSLWPGTAEFSDQNQNSAVSHEAGKLALNIERASSRLGWRPVWGFEKALNATVSWYQSISESPASAEEITLNQIWEFENEIR